MTNLIIALALTELIEAITAYIMGNRGKRFYLTLFLANLITNPSINFIICLLYYFKVLYFPIIIFLEILVVIVEWRIYKYIFPKKKSLLLASIITNLLSYIFGLLIF